MLVLERIIGESVDIQPNPEKPEICFSCVLQEIRVSEVILVITPTGANPANKTPQTHCVPIRGAIDLYYRNAKRMCNTKIQIKFLRNNDYRLGKSVYLGFDAPKSVSFTRHDAKERTPR